MEGFLRRNFEFLHGTCRREWIAAACDSLDSQVELVQSDALLRIPNMDTGSDFQSELELAVETDAALLACVLYRIQRGIFLNDEGNSALRVLAHLMRFRTGAEIYYSTDIGPRLNVQHGHGLVIGPRYRIGSDFIVHQGVTLGQRRLFSPDEKIVIGDRCSIFAGAKVLGDVRIADDVFIGANAVLLHDADEPGTYVGIPAGRVR